MLSADWKTGREKISVSRVFEHTDPHIAEQFRKNSSPDPGCLTRLPCLFMQEGTGDEIAYVGQINRPRIAGSEVDFEYTIDAAVPPLRNHMIHAKRAELDMSDNFEFSCNHWAVKDADL